VLRELPTTAQLAALAGGEIDIGVIRGPVGLPSSTDNSS